jgi:RNA polymerase sigma-70 factor (ECF subfamily)
MTSSERVDFGFDKDAKYEVRDGMSEVDCQEAYSCVDPDELALQEIIRLIVNQDQVAFKGLFKAMATRVHNLALRITRNVQLAEEVTEDTFFQVWRQAPRFDASRGTVRAWVLTIARSRALDALRSIPPFENSADAKLDATIDEPICADVPDLLSTIEQNQLLHGALKTLEPLPRQLIALSFFRGLSHEEIAVHAELPLGTVKSHIRRAVIHLRETLTTIA